MAQLQQPFNAQQFDPTAQGGSFQQLPVGKHPVVITASEVKATSDGSGGMVVYELEVIDGPNKGATGPMRINLYNQSDKARQIAESQQSALCYATGVFMLQDTAQLHGKPFMVEVENQPLTAQQQEKKNAGENVTPFTQVRKILNADGSMPGLQGGAAQSNQGQSQQQSNNQGNWGNQGQQNQNQGNWGNQNQGGQSGGQSQGNWGGNQNQGGGNNWQQGGNQGQQQGKPSWGK